MPKDTSARTRLAHLLASLTDARVGADSAEMHLPADALRVEVAGHGPLRFPVQASEAKELIAVARQAQFGRGARTVSDSSVRDTWELTPDQVAVGGASWPASLEAVLEGFRVALGLPTGSRLRAELHALLVYGKDQFFLPHQDSEKADDMVATMVVALPSVHTGGELVVDDGGHQRTYRGSGDELVLVAFYADRRHEVKPVRSGYRVTLTFNLMLTAGSQLAPTEVVAEVADHLREHFTTRVRAAYSGADLGEPARLAFLLDHDYSQHGLAASRFKGADAERVAVLRAAAEHAGCECVLALSEIKETWEAGPDVSNGSWRDEFSWDRDDIDAADIDNPIDDADDYVLDSLIDHEIVLGWWTTPGDAEGEVITLPLDHHEVCAVTPTRDLAPYQSEYEGYMGNYGNTVDRWYRRAAVVIWPEDNAFVARAEAGSGWALQSLRARIEAGDLEAARADAASLEPFWRGVEAERLPLALEVAAGLGDAASARVLLGPFTLEMLTARDAPALAELAGRYGHRWTAGLLELWDSPNRHRPGDRGRWTSETLVPLSQALRDAGAASLADSLVDLVWRALSGRVHGCLSQPRDDVREAGVLDLAVPVARVVEAASDEAGLAIAEELGGSGYRAHELLVPVLRELHPGQSRPAVTMLASVCRTALNDLLAKPVRDPGDWSIAWDRCGCDLCGRLAEFLGSSTAQSLDWPLAQAGRQHVHHQIETAGLPVRHTTRRQGRPYTLLLRKTEELFKREAESRRRAEASLAWLTSDREGPSRR